ncbi:MAG: trypsin-like peptidase domain-containing protein [Verrucomicrobiota bacterium]
MRRLILGIALGLLAGTAAYQWRVNHRDEPVAPPPLVSAPKLEPLQVPVLAALEEDYTRLVQSVVPSVVSITTQKRIRQRVPMVVDAFDLLFGTRQQRVVEQTETGLGSGVVVSPEGYVLTNDHVVAGMEEIRVQLTDGRIEPADLIGTDPQTDIAVLKIKGPVTALSLGDSDKVRVGQPVLAVGNPFGLQETVTQGIISAKGRAVQDSGVEFLQTDAAVNQGNSGGPLLNFRGEIIGINSAIYSKSGTWLGISFAIPANVARQSMESILRTGKVQRPTLGVSTMALTPSLARQFGLREPVGALVTQVKPSSPAEKAGIQPGDVIVGVNGKILPDPAGLQKALAGKPVGTRVQLNVIRDGREYNVQAEVASLPETRAPR